MTVILLAGLLLGASCDGGSFGADSGSTLSASNEPPGDSGTSGTDSATPGDNEIMAALEATAGELRQAHVQHRAAVDSATDVGEVTTIENDWQSAFQQADTAFRAALTEAQGCEGAVAYDADFVAFLGHLDSLGLLISEHAGSHAGHLALDECLATEAPHAEAIELPLASIDGLIGTWSSDGLCDPREDPGG